MSCSAREGRGLPPLLSKCGGNSSTALRDPLVWWQRQCISPRPTCAHHIADTQHAHIASLTPNTLHMVTATAAACGIGAPHCAVNEPRTQLLALLLPLRYSTCSSLLLAQRPQLAKETFSDALQVIDFLVLRTVPVEEASTCCDSTTI